MDATHASTGSPANTNDLQVAFMLSSSRTTGLLIFSFTFQRVDLLGYPPIRADRTKKTGPRFNLLRRRVGANTLAARYRHLADLQMSPVAICAIPLVVIVLAFVIGMMELISSQRPDDLHRRQRTRPIAK